MDGNHDTGEFRPLRLMDRQNIGQSQLVQIREVIFYLMPIKIHHHFLFDPANGLDLPEIAVENMPIIVVFGLDYQDAKAKRPRAA